MFFKGGRVLKNGNRGITSQQKVEIFLDCNILMWQDMVYENRRSALTKGTRGDLEKKNFKAGLPSCEFNSNAQVLVLFATFYSNSVKDYAKQTSSWHIKRSHAHCTHIHIQTAQQIARQHEINFCKTQISCTYKTYFGYLTESRLSFKDKMKLPWLARQNSFVHVRSHKPPNILGILQP